MYIYVEYLYGSMRSIYVTKIHKSESLYTLCLRLFDYVFVPTLLRLKSNSYKRVKKVPDVHSQSYVFLLSMYLVNLLEKTLQLPTLEYDSYSKHIGIINSTETVRNQSTGNISCYVSTVTFIVYVDSTNYVLLGPRKIWDPSLPILERK